MKFVKSVEWLNKQLKENRIRIIDCTYSLNDPDFGKNMYKEKHIPGAVYFDLAEDLSGEIREHGGRHPLPEMQDFKRKCELSGINEDVMVIAYDAGEGCFASRFWWLLKYAGHPHVYLLDGGMKEWEKAGLPVTDLIPVYQPVEFNIKVDPSILADYSEVKARSKDKMAALIDSRASERYLGKVEPLDAKPGHIPNAINKEWTEGFHDGRWKKPDAQKERFKEFHPDEELIVYCGSGVTATPNFIALLESGYKNVKLYAGSYSDWVSYPHSPVEKGSSKG